MRLRSTALRSIRNDNELTAIYQIAGAMPTLDLWFANSKSLVDAISGQNLITFTRASTATYVDGDGLVKTAATNEARFTHDPTTGASLGLLVEEQRTNLLLYSEDFTNTWTTFNSTISGNAATAPSGALTADKLIPNNGASDGLARQDITGLTDSTTYTGSIFVKAAGLETITVQFYNKANLFHCTKVFNASTGELSGSDTNAVTSVFTYPNGWFRLVFAGLNSGSGATTPNIRIVSSVTGNGTAGINLWGAQLEAGSFATSYIPTTTAAVTRSADVVSITGSNFSSWYRQDQGTFFASAQNSQNTSGVIYGVGDTFDNTLYVTASTASNVAVRSGNAVQALISAPVSSSLSRTAVAYRQDDFAATSNGGTVSLDSLGLVPVNPVRLKIGSSAWDSTGQNSPNCSIPRLTYWPQRLSNSILQALTA